MVNQIETHLYYQRTTDQHFHRELGVQVESWGTSPRAATTCSPTRSSASWRPTASPSPARAPLARAAGRRRDPEVRPPRAERDRRRLRRPPGCRRLGDLVDNAAAKDGRIDEAAKKHGALDDRFGPVSRDAPGAVSLGGRYVCAAWPQESAWDFVAVGVGHDVDWWTEFLRAVQDIDPEKAVNIESEDRDHDEVEGPGMAARLLLDAAKEV